MHLSLSIVIFMLFSRLLSSAHPGIQGFRMERLANQPVFQPFMPAANCRSEAYIHKVYLWMDTVYAFVHYTFRIFPDVLSSYFPEFRSSPSRAAGNNHQASAHRCSCLYILLLMALRGLEYHNTNPAGNHLFL